MTYVTADKSYTTFPINRTYFIRSCPPESGLPGTLRFDFFVLASGLWPLEQRRPPRWRDEPIVLREVAQSPAYDSARSRQEKVDGRWCHVLERKGHDILWIDVDRGCVLLARETYDSTRGALMQRFELGGHREVAPGVWLPKWLRNAQYDYAAQHETDRKREVSDSRFVVLEASVNDVEDSTFRFKLLPGSAVLTKVDKVAEQTQAGGLGHLDDVVQWARRYWPVAPLQIRSAWGWLAGLPAMLVILIFEIRRRL